MKNVAVLMEDGAFALFSHPHPRGFDSSRVPTPGNLPSKAEKMLMPGDQPGGSWAQLGLTDALQRNILCFNKMVQPSSVKNIYSWCNYYRYIVLRYVFGFLFLKTEK